MYVDLEEPWIDFERMRVVSGEALAPGPIRSLDRSESHPRSMRCALDAAPEFNRPISIEVQVRRMAVQAAGERQRASTLEDHAQILDAREHLLHHLLVKHLARSQSYVTPYTTVGSHMSNASLRAPCTWPRSGFR